jgi:hypothetical protein
MSVETEETHYKTRTGLPASALRYKLWISRIEAGILTTTHQQLVSIFQTLGVEAN